MDKLRAPRRGVRAVAHRRARRRRPSPIGVHAGRARVRAMPSTARARWPRRSPNTSRSSATRASTRASARSTSCRSSRSAERTPNGRRRPTKPARSASWWAEAFTRAGVLYDDADPERPRSPARAHARLPSRDRPTSDPTNRTRRLGATAVGARRPLVAINCVLVARDVVVARRIARAMRERDGGLRGVRARSGSSCPTANARRCR